MSFNCILRISHSLAYDPVSILRCPACPVRATLSSTQLPTAAYQCPRSCPNGLELVLDVLNLLHKAAEDVRLGREFIQLGRGQTALLEDAIQAGQLL